MGEAITFLDQISAESSETDIVMERNHTLAETIGEAFQKSALASLSPSRKSPHAPRLDQYSSGSLAELLQLCSSVHMPRITWP